MKAQNIPINNFELVEQVLTQVQGQVDEIFNCYNHGINELASYRPQKPRFMLPITQVSEKVLQPWRDIEALES